MKILVCGGAGYIGSHMVLALLDKGHEVIIFDNLSQGFKQAVDKRAAFFLGDITRTDDIDKAFKENEIEAVIHFAASIEVGESVSNPLKYFENNVYGTLNLLKVMEKYGVKHIVFSSTAAVYGIPGSVPVKESDPTSPINPYGESKLCVEKLLKWCDGAYGIKHGILRYFNVCGAHESGRIGEAHENETHLIPLVLQVPLGKRNKAYIYGDDYATPDGTCIRDYIHVTDLCEAHLLTLEHIMKTNESTTYNLGSDKGFSVKEIIAAAEKVTGTCIETEVIERRAGDPPVLIASGEKIRNELGFEPKYKDINQIIQSAWNWHKNNPDGYNS